METIQIIESGTRCKTTAHADWFGIVCSFLCAVHCSGVPVLVSVLPELAGTNMPGQPIFHQIAAVVCSVLVVLAIVPGYRTNGSWTMALLTVTGLTCVLAAAFILPQACCRPTCDSDKLICGLQSPVQVVSPWITIEHLQGTPGVKTLSDYSRLGHGCLLWRDAAHFGMA
ncbi:MAG: MerC domain-containing protein [Planctomycetaceae bacterium]